jgi:hypothetical protein
MPNAMARMVFLTGLTGFSYVITERKKLWWLITLLLFSSLVGIKVYYGIFVILGTGLVYLFLLMRSFVKSIRKKRFGSSLKVAFSLNWLLLVFLLTLLGVAAAIFLPVNKNSGGLGWYPLEWPKIFLGPSGLNWGDWFLRQQVYEQSHNLRNIVFYDAVAILITLICVHGTRLIGLLPSRKTYKKLGWEWVIFFFPGLILFHILGLFTLQKAGGFNVFNFFVVSTVVLSLLSAIVLDSVRFSFKRPLLSLALILLIVLSIPRSISELTAVVYNMQHPSTGSVLISNDELAGLTFIREHTPKSAIVQSHPSDRSDSDTPYVSFFSERLTYLTGEGLQRTHNQPIEDREKRLQELFSVTDSPGFQTRARSNGIDYVYLKNTDEQKISFEVDSHLMEKVYENKSVTIYKIR